MSSLSFSQFLPLPRCHFRWSHCYALKVVQFGELRVQCKPGHVAMARPRKKASVGSVEEEPSENEPVVEKKVTKVSKAKKVTAKTATKKKKESIAESPEGAIDLLVSGGDGSIEEGLSPSSDGSEKVTAKTKKKKKSIVESPKGAIDLLVSGGDGSIEEGLSQSSDGSKKVTAKTKKKSIAESPEGAIDLLVSGGDGSIEEGLSPSSDGSKKKTQNSKKKDSSSSAGLEEEKEVKEKKKVTKQRKPKEENAILEDKYGAEAEIDDQDEPSSIENVEDESDDGLELIKDDGEDISYTYSWPPLVCCFGAAHHAFVPSGRPANRLIDHELHERNKDALWSPDKFVRAPGGSAGSVAIALASLGGKVAFMGKLADDDYGQAMLYYMNANNVQTRSVRIDSKRATGVSLMKIYKRKLKLSCVRPCAEDCLTKAEINIDVLKEAKMFYFNTHSLLDRKMRSTTLQAIKIAKHFGAVVFYDVNLPMPLWHSQEETKTFIQQVWNLADIIEVTKQELEFLCGITPSEEFDTKNNARSKFVHYDPEVVAPLWHESLKVLFVTNGTSKIHYYTAETDGAVHGMEDAPITPFTRDMSASGDGIVAAIMRMLTVQSDLITDKAYLEHSIKYAIDCGVIDQWIHGRVCGFPPEEDMEDNITPDPNGIKSITETEYRTLLEPVS